MKISLTNLGYDIMNIKSYNKLQVSNLVLSEHFRGSEFDCSHCHNLKIDTNLINKLELLRNILGVPIQITSGYRCITHNANVGGASNSYHIKGMACDFNCYGKINGIDVLDEVAKIFKRYGFYQSSNKNCCYIHVDTFTTNRCWLSRKINNKNNYQYFNSLTALKACMLKDKNIDWFNLVI